MFSLNLGVVTVKLVSNGARGGRNLRDIRFAEGARASSHRCCGLS